MPPTLLPVPHHKQSHDGACLPACARMVLAYLGQNVTEADLAQLLGTQWFGTPAPNLHRLASLGYQVTYESTTLKMLQARVSARQPPLVFVETGDLPYWRENTSHVVVVIGLDQDHIYVNDPAFDTAPQMIPLTYFLLAWSEFDHRYALIQPGP